MMVESVDLRFIRCYDHCRVELVPGINMFFGSNGVGKTTLLEAIHAVSTCSSFKAGYLYEMIQKGHNAGKIRVYTSEEKLALEIHRRSKKFFLGERKITGQRNFVGKVPTVVLAPEHGTLIEGGKQARQMFVDQILMHKDGAYNDLIKKQNKVLAQKRGLLKQELPYAVYLDHAQVWHQQNKTLTIDIRAKRQAFLTQAQPFFIQTYQEVSQKSSELALTYEPCHDHAPLDEGLLRQEYYAKRVLYGSQRDDIKITLEGRPTQKHASQGEKATMLLGLKFAELLILQDQGIKPVFLLDDVGTTLDQTRREQLFAKLAQVSCQAIVSTCDRYIQQQIGNKHPNSKLFAYNIEEKKWT